MIRFLVAVCAFTLGMAAQDISEGGIPKENPYSTPADVARGQRLFLGHCAPCHGPTGDGGRGANLALPRLPRGPDDPTLFRVVKDGILGTEMPGAWEMIDREIWQVVAYVRTLGRTAVEKVRGDPARGQNLYRTKGNCGQCHTIRGQGGRMGPELTEIGARRSPRYLRATLVDPESATPEGFLLVRIVTKDGRRLTGIRLNEDTYTVQIRDLADRLHSFWKADLKEFHKDRSSSPMPSYRDQFSETELEDIVTYLVSLRGGS